MKNTHRFDLPTVQQSRQGWRQRLRSDFRLAIISLFGLATVLGILPLAAYRFLVHDWLTGTGDVLLVLAFSVLVVYAWRSGRTQVVARLMAIVMTLGYLGLVTFGDISILWAFPILSAGFLLAERAFASISALLTLLVTAFYSGRLDAAVEIWSFMTTGLLVAIFGLIFATQTRMQRQQLSEIASRDPLTGAGNRRALRQALDQVERDFLRRGTPASLVLIDLDHFKSVNDVYGHEAGDVILMSLVEILQESLRADDGVFRIGGEEFVLVLSGTELPDALSVAEKLKQTLASRLEGPGGQVTASMGVAQLEDGESVRSWLSRADEALYLAKRRGRNRIEHGLDAET